MYENGKQAQRRDVFTGQDRPAANWNGADSSQFAIRLVAPTQRWSLRADAAALVDGATAGGFDIGQPINSARLTAAHSNGGTPKRLSCRLGPDEWLLIGGDADDPRGAAEHIHRDLDGVFHTLVDVSHRNVAFEIAGARSADVLNTGCRLDLGAAAFPSGTATRTLFAKAEIILVRHPDIAADMGPAPCYRIECWRSFARYLYAHLLDSARLLGTSG